MYHCNTVKALLLTYKTLHTLPRLSHTLSRFHTQFCTLSSSRTVSRTLLRPSSTLPRPSRELSRTHSKPYQQPRQNSTNFAILPPAVYEVNKNFLSVLVLLASGKINNSQNRTNRKSPNIYSRLYLYVTFAQDSYSLVYWHICWTLNVVNIYL
jgi:hypothetical protein